MKILPVRKTNRLKSYNYSQNGYYFITLCVLDNQELLGKVVGDDAHIVPPTVVYSEYGRIVEKHIKNVDSSYDDIIVANYIIMPNHVHMIIVLQKMPHNENLGTMWASSPTSARIPTIIRTLKTLVAKECGLSFWQRSYHDHVIRTEQKYNIIWKYIDENPLKWHEDCFYPK